MSAEITVYFTCPCCELVYQARQVRSSERMIGRINCVKCFTTVHSWTGVYDFVLWKPMTQRRRTATPKETRRPIDMGNRPRELFRGFDGRHPGHHREGAGITCLRK